MKSLKFFLIVLVFSLAFLTYPLFTEAASIIQENPQEAEVTKHLKEGAEQVQTGKFQEAIEPLKKALSLKPDTTKQAIAHYLLGIAYTGLQKKDEAIREYKESVSLKPDFLNGQSALAKACFASGKFEDAVTAYKEVAKLNPKSDEAFFGIGASYVSLKRFSEALEPLQQAIKIKPGLAAAHYYLGQIHLQLNNKDEASKELEALKSLNSPFATQLSTQIERFSASLASSKEVEPGNTKVPGRILVGIAPIKNVAGVAMPINEMRARLVRRVLNAYFDANALEGNKTEEVITNAKDQSCDYIIYTEILSGNDERPRTDRIGGLGEQSTQVKVRLKLVAVGNDKAEFETTVSARENREALGDFTGISTVDTAVREVLDELRKKTDKK